MGAFIGIIVTLVTLATVAGSLFLVFKVVGGIQGKQAATGGLWRSNGAVLRRRPRRRLDIQLRTNEESSRRRL